MSRFESSRFVRNPQIMNAKEIADDIKANVQYPGEIKVSVIRETRVTEYAK